MRAVIVFAPCANATYVPLGLASLSEYIKKYSSGCELRVLDLNIKTWSRIAGEQKLEPMADFMRGKAGDFFDSKQYLNHLELLGSAAKRIEELINDSKAYLEKNQIGNALGAFLDFYSKEILTNDPELIGFSILFPKQVLISLACAKYLKNQVNCQSKFKIIAGGATISALNSDELLKCCPYIDAVFSGEGEEGLQKLCEAKEYSEIAGLIYRDEAGSIKTNKKPDSISLSKIPLPLFDDIDLSEYFNPEPVLPVIFSRGCMWRKCRFCAHNFSYGGYRKHGIAEIADYLTHLSKKGTKHFYFADQYVDARDLQVLSAEILNRGLKIHFQVMCRPTEDYSPGILEMLSRAGCRWISWGVESGSQRLLEICGKGTKVEIVKKVLRDSHNAGIANLAMMIFGLPGGDETDLTRTLDFLDDIAPYAADITSSSFALFERTAFAANAPKYGLKVIDRDAYFSSASDKLHSLRLFFQEYGKSGSTRPARGPMEIAQWEHRRNWGGWRNIYGDLCCEHFLLYASHGVPSC